MSLKRASSCVSDVPKIKKICSDSVLEIERSRENAVTGSRIDEPVEGSFLFSCFFQSDQCFFSSGYCFLADIFTFIQAALCLKFALCSLMLLGDRKGIQHVKCLLRNPLGYCHGD